MNICIFCSAYEVHAKYVKDAEEISELLAKAGYHLVWGGSDTGLMKVIANVFRKNGGKLYGVSIEVYKEALHQSADEMIIAKDLGTRKAAMLDKSDAVLILPGGLGTLDEFTEVLELRKQKHHSKPIIVLNTDNFYGGIIAQLKKMQAEGFTQDLEPLVSFVNTPKEVTTILGQLNALT